MCIFSFLRHFTSYYVYFLLFASFYVLLRVLHVFCVIFLLPITCITCFLRHFTSYYVYYVVFVPFYNLLRVLIYRLAAVETVFISASGWLDGLLAGLMAGLMAGLLDVA